MGTISNLELVKTDFVNVLGNHNKFDHNYFRQISESEMS